MGSAGKELATTTETKQRNEWTRLKNFVQEKGVEDVFVHNSWHLCLECVVFFNIKNVFTLLLFMELTADLCAFLAGKRNVNPFHPLSLILVP